MNSASSIINELFEVRISEIAILTEKDKAIIELEDGSLNMEFCKYKKARVFFTTISEICVVNFKNMVK